MRKFTNVSNWLCAGALAIAAAVPGAMAQDKLRLTVANGNPPTIPSTWWMTDFIGPKLVEYTNGRVAVNMQVNSTLCVEHKCVEQAKLGQIDIGQISGGSTTLPLYATRVHWGAVSDPKCPMFAPVDSAKH